MKTFVVAWINFYDNELNQRIVQGKDILTVARAEFLDVICNGDATDDTLEVVAEASLQELADEAFNLDAAFSVVEVPK